MLWHRKNSGPKIWELARDEIKQLKGLEEFRKVIKKWKHSSFLCKFRKQNNYMVTFLLLGVLFLAVLTLFFIFSFTLWVDIQFLLPCFCFCFVFFFFLSRLISRTFTIHRTSGEGGELFFNFSLPLQPASQTLRY